MKRFFGGLFQVVGGMVAGLSGLCSFFVIIGGAKTVRNANDVLEGLVLVGVCGGIPFVIGIALFGIGKRIRKPVKDKKYDTGLSQAGIEKDMSDVNKES